MEDIELYELAKAEGLVDIAEPFLSLIQDQRSARARVASVENLLRTKRAGVISSIKGMHKRTTELQAKFDAEHAPPVEPDAWLDAIDEQLDVLIERSKCEPPNQQLRKEIVHFHNALVDLRETVGAAHRDQWLATSDRLQREIFCRYDGPRNAAKAAREDQAQ